MHEAGQLVAVQEHPGTPGLAAHHVLNMVGKRVVVIGERDQFIAIRMGENP